MYVCRRVCIAKISKSVSKKWKANTRKYSNTLERYIHSFFFHTYIHTYIIYVYIIPVFFFVGSDDDVGRVLSYVVQVRSGTPSFPMFVCMYVGCMYVCMYVCIWVVCMYVCMYVCMWVVCSLSLCNPPSTNPVHFLYSAATVSIYCYMYVCIVCMYVFVSMHVCMYVCGLYVV